MEVLMTNELNGDRTFDLEYAQKVICYQLRNNITGDKAWNLTAGFKYEVVTGQSCCGGKGKIVVSKITITKPKSKVVK